MTKKKTDGGGDGDKIITQDESDRHFKANPHVRPGQSDFISQTKGISSDDGTLKTFVFDEVVIKDVSGFGVTFGAIFGPPPGTEKLRGKPTAYIYNYGDSIGVGWQAYHSWSYWLPRGIPHGLYLKGSDGSILVPLGLQTLSECWGCTDYREKIPGQNKFYNYYKDIITAELRILPGLWDAGGVSIPSSR